MPDRPPAALAGMATPLSDRRMKAPGPVWVDDRNPIYRRGLVACLRAEGYAVAGESVALRPPPNPTTTSLLIFDVEAAGFESALALARRSEMGVIGLVRQSPTEQVRELLAAGMFTVLPLRSLTPSRLLASIQALAENAGSPAATRPSRRVIPRRLERATRLTETSRGESWTCSAFSPKAAAPATLPNT